MIFVVLHSGLSAGYAMRNACYNLKDLVLLTGFNVKYFSSFRPPDPLAPYNPIFIWDSKGEGIY
jgi:hypothetical protein